MAKKKLSANATRRAAARARQKIGDASEKLARLEPGGTPENPIEVESASLVEPQAKGLPCPRCGGEARLVDHEAQTFHGQLLRVVSTRCYQCGAPRTLYVKIVPALVN